MDPDNEPGRRVTAGRIIGMVLLTGVGAVLVALAAVLIVLVLGVGLVGLIAKYFFGTLLVGGVTLK